MVLRELFAAEENFHLFLLRIYKTILWLSSLAPFSEQNRAKQNASYTPCCAFKDSGCWDAKARTGLQAERHNFQAV